MKKFLIPLALLLVSVLLINKSYGNDERPENRGAYKIAYISLETNNIEVFLSDAEGISSIQRTNVKGGYMAWSPDGNQFAYYAKYDEKRTWSIHTMNVDGTNSKRLTHAKNKWDYAPTWSPDGKYIAFARQYRDADNTAHQEIWIMKSDGSGKTQIKALTGGSPYFTPSGRIVFQSEHKNKKSEISIANIDGSNALQLTNNDATELHPKVSPDGDKIAFMSDRDGNFEIYVMNIDGTNQTRLTFNNVRDSMPSWSFDGSKIAFLSVKVPRKELHTYVMNKDGSSKKKIIPNSRGAVFQP